MNKQLKKIKAWIKEKSTAYSCFCMGGAVMMVNFVYADSFTNAAKGAAEGLQSSAASATKYLIMMALVVIGIAVAFGTRNQRENAKERVPSLGIGVAVILGAAGLANLIFGWFE